MSVTPELAMVIAEIAQANQQWEWENNRLGGDAVWSESHVALLARAAIQALREPTEGMKEAGAAVGIFHPYEAEVLPFAPDEAGAIFTAVLDHVLGEPK